MKPGRRLREVQVALMFLTRLPAGRVTAPVPTLAEARWAFPLAGAVVGLAGWAVFAAATAAGLAASVGALLAIAAASLVTGALHEDGLADLADGFGGGGNRARKLEIMRDSRIGSYGVLALILSVGLRWASAAEIGPELAAFVGLGVASRCAMVIAGVILPSARDDGLGRSADGKGGWRPLAALAIAAAALMPLGFAGVAAAIVMACASLALVALAARQIGGQTGDVLGATQQVAETAGWLTLAAVYGG